LKSAVLCVSASEIEGGFRILAIYFKQRLRNGLNIDQGLGCRSLTATTLVQSQGSQFGICGG
jgi:hypothetical protein